MSLQETPSTPTLQPKAVEQSSNGHSPVKATKDFDFLFAPVGVLPKNINVVFDIEANHLLEKVTKVWVLVLQNFYTKEFYIFTDQELSIKYPKHGSLQDGVVFLSQCKSMICHNFMGYDYFLMNKFWPALWNLDLIPLNKCHDTLSQSRAQFYDRPPRKGVRGNHGLAYYGDLFDFPKPPIEDWSFWDEDKLHRCLVDVEINRRTLVYLQEEKKKLQEIGIDTTWQTNIVKNTQYWLTQQELNGFKGNTELMYKHVETLDKRLLELEHIVEPMLPKVLKVKNKKCTWEEVRDKWAAFYRNVPQTKYEKVKKAGEIVEAPIKEAYMPTIKYTLKNGMYDINTAKWFEIAPDPEESDHLVQGAYTKIYFEEARLTQHAVVKDFLLTLGWMPDEWNYATDIYGNWLKDERGNKVKSSPKLTESSFESLPEGIGQQIAEYNTLSHRRRTFLNEKDDEKGWINSMREDGRISAGAQVFATSTGRHAQKNIVNCPSSAAKFGSQMREVWVADHKHTLVSTDMDSAQLRLLANYMGDDLFTEAVCNGEEVSIIPEAEFKGGNYLKHEDGVYEVYTGTDAHTLNSIYFGLNEESDVIECRETQDHDLYHKISKGRKRAKNGIYCLLFGGGDAKFANTIGMKSVQQGKATKETYFLRLPKIKQLIDRLKTVWKNHPWQGGGYIQVAGGVWLFCNSEHKLLNYLLMGSEAQVQNVGICWANQQILKNKVKSKMVLTIHDENTFETAIEDVDKQRMISDAMYGKASEILKLDVKVTGSAKTGINYLEVH